MGPNIILVGFSTTGKSQVARKVAQLLNWSAIDTDAEVERLAGKSITDIFRQDGQAVFRELERQALLSACGREQVVIATGGGAVLDSRNRELMLARGLVVCLEAEPQTIYQRLRRDAENPVLPIIRPLLTVADPLKQIHELKAGRKPFYALAHVTIATDTLSIEEVSHEVVKYWQQWQEKVVP